MRVSVEGRVLRLRWRRGRDSRYHALWLRDNCGCGDCREMRSGERLLYTADLPGDLSLREAGVDSAGNLAVEWSDGHRALFDPRWLAEHDPAVAAASHAELRLWGRELRMPEFVHADLLASRERMLGYLDALAAHGVALVRDAPAVDGEVRRFAQRIGVVRTVAFGDVHDVTNDPSGYNVAHTALALKPHTDLASYSWPPSGQLLHYLVNEVTGGETVLVDGWNVLAELRRVAPAAFRWLCRVPVPFKISSHDRDTYASEPLIRLDTDGNVCQLRFSNQTAQPLRLPADQVEPFYDAYCRLGRLIEDPRFRVELKARRGDMLTVHNHRVLHGRRAYDPASGHRHLQDLYLEWDDVMATRRVLRGHRPRAAWPSSTPAG